MERGGGVREGRGMGREGANCIIIIPPHKLG